MQLQLPFPDDREPVPKSFEEAFLLRLGKLTGTRIELTITDNASSMISVRKERGSAVLRLHRMFLQAGPEVLHELAAFIRNVRVKTPLIRRFIRDHAASLPERPVKKTRLVTRGRYHDLAGMAEAVNREYFGGRISSGITWGSRKTGHSVRRRILGSYNSRTDVIRVNPVLDRKETPRYYLEFILYHEMLHADMGVRRKNGRREVHSREFRRREKIFRHFDRALLWEKKG